MFIFGFSFYHPVTLVRCPSFVPFAATRFLFLLLFIHKVFVFFWLSTLPSNSSIRVGLSFFPTQKGINVHSQSSSVEATSPYRSIFFGLNSPPLSSSLLIPVLFCSFLCIFGIKRHYERERAQERNGGSERWLWLKRRVVFVFFLPPF